MFSFTFIFSKLFYPQPTHKRAAGLSQTIACGGRTEEEVWKHQRPVYCILGHYTGTQTPNDFGGENGLLTSEARGGLWTNGNVLFVCEAYLLAKADHRPREKKKFYHLFSIVKYSYLPTDTFRKYAERQVT